MMKQVHEEQSDMQEILADLGDDCGKGAFMCEYGVFKKIYQLEIRRAERLGISVFLSLISVRVRVDGTGLSGREKAESLVRGMKKMQNILLSSLRSGDVITRCSGSQYMLLLPTCQYETAIKVMKRIENTFYRNNSEPNISMEYHLEGLEN